MHVYDEAGVQYARGVIRRHPQDGYTVTIFAEHGAYAVKRIRFVQRNAIMAVAAVGCTIASAAADEIQKLLGAGGGEEEASVVGGTCGVWDSIKRFC
jgi:hypothetical protein